MRKRGERTFDNKKIEKKEIFICVCAQSSVNSLKLSKSAKHTQNLSISKQYHKDGILLKDGFWKMEKVTKSRRRRRL